MFTNILSLLTLFLVSTDGSSNLKGTTIKGTTNKGTYDLKDFTLFRERFNKVYSDEEVKTKKRPGTTSQVAEIPFALPGRVQYLPELPAGFQPCALRSAGTSAFAS